MPLENMRMNAIALSLEAHVNSGITVYTYIGKTHFDRHCCCKTTYLLCVIIQGI